jgi:uncharacterized protein
MTTLALAAISARMMAEAAAQAGYSVVAMDLFGDRDTRAASSEWLPIGMSAGLGVDPDAALRALRLLARRGDVDGWVAGSGFEGLPDVLEQGAATLPLIGNPVVAVRRVRDPATFFGFLDSVAVAHPQVRNAPPADTTGWLTKNALGTGGWHIRRASTSSESALPEHSYFQRLAPGVPMSATFIVNGRSACVLGFNEMIVRSFGARPFVFCGAIGPVALDAAVEQELTRALQLLAAEFSLRGLGSLDFMLDGRDIALLEVNPRPSASIGLYAQHVPHGVMAAHVRACLHDELPLVVPAPRAVRGNEIVFARRRLVLDESASARLAAWPHCHDLPAAGASFDIGDPLCSVSAGGSTAARVRTQLTERREALLNTLETWA